MITNTLALLSTLLLTILVVPLLCKKSRIPSIVGFIVVGMLIGPNALDLVAYSQTIDTIGKLGILYILFQAGIELDKNDFLQQRRQALSFGLIALLFPALLGGLGGWALGYTWQTCVLLGALLGSHTLITYPIVSKYNLQKLPAVGIVVGGTLVTVALSLLVLGVMHVKDSWWVWLLAGLAFCALSLFITSDTLSIIAGGFAFCCLWGIHEMFLQEKRVLRGWFPENPKRHDYYERRRKEMQGKL